MNILYNENVNYSNIDYYNVNDSDEDDDHINLKGIISYVIMTWALSAVT